MLGNHLSLCVCWHHHHQQALEALAHITGDAEGMAVTPRLMDAGIRVELLTEPWVGFHLLVAISRPANPMGDNAGGSVCMR